MPEMLQILAPLVVKEHVSLGGLKSAQRQAVLALAASALASGQVVSEPQVNAALKHFLAEAGGFIGVDHVELRRWLVDMGWLARDGWGREYRRVPQFDLPAEHAAMAADLAAVNLPDWVAGLRAGVRARRTMRRQAWELRSA